MKVHTTEKQEKEILLSIGMIVKNEEKVLERCLKSLQPLMKAVPSELIIADTGSTDSTVEIAKKYTDNVFHFEWINDFAAARNSTLEKAKGKWYFFLDADEYLDEDIHEIVDFFKVPELYSHYKTAQLYVRNYYDKAMSSYNDNLLSRFQRIVNNDPNEIVAFVGSIHETMYTRFPLGYFQTILHHTGYTYLSNAQLRRKQERNLTLMREEYNNTLPDARYRIISLLLDCSSFYPEETEKYISEAMDLVKKDINNPFSRGLYIQAINYYKTIKPLYALELVEAYYQQYPNASEYVATVAVSRLKAEIYEIIGENEKAYEWYLIYLENYKAYKEEKMDISDCSYRTIIGINDYDYISGKYAVINCLLNLRNYKKALSYFETIELSKLKDSDYTQLIVVLKTICIKSKKYKEIACYYDTIMNSSDDNRKNIMLGAIETTFYTWSIIKDRLDFAKQIIESGAKGKYIDLMKLYISQEDDDFTEKLCAFIYSVDEWKVGYTEAIYLAVKAKIDITEIIDKMPTSLFGEKLSLIADTHDDFAELVLEYGVPSKFSANIKRFSWIVTMHEVAVYRCFELNDKKKRELYLRFTNLLGEYVSNIYNPELLQDEEDIEVLPPLHKFGYYMLQANNNLMNGDSIGYIKEMKKALLNCEPMKEIVEFMLEQFKKNMGLR